MLQFGVFWLNKVLLLSLGMICVLYLYCGDGVCTIGFDVVWYWYWLSYAGACLKIIVVSVWGIMLVIFLILSSVFFLA